jgi:Winged helix DNA-binding domain
MARTVPSYRQLNRATLARQLLLDRSDMGIADAVAWLLGLQGQVSEGPYQGLWSRLRDFRHEDLTRLIVDRSLVRATSMRATLHLHTPDDLIGIRQLVQPVVDRMWHAAFNKRFGPNDREIVRKAGVELLNERPMTSGELGKALQEQFPAGEPLAKAVLLQVVETLIQIPPTRIWGSGHSPILTRIENWLPPPYERPIARETLVLRYLAAYGPASVADMQSWCGMTRLGEVFEALRQQLMTFSDETGKELFDLPGAPRPDADTPAPVRLLPLYDNVYLGYDNRRRMLSEATAGRVNMLQEYKPAILIDGMVAAGWAVSAKRGAAVIAIETYRKLSQSETRELKAEAAAFLGFMRPDARSLDVTLSGVGND